MALTLAERLRAHEQSKARLAEAEAKLKGPEGPAARKRTLAYCTQYRGPG